MLLAAGPPTRWCVELVDGAIVEVWADSVTGLSLPDDDRDYIFSSLMDIDPALQDQFEVTGRTPTNPSRVIVTVAHFPRASVRDITSRAVTRQNEPVTTAFRFRVRNSFVLTDRGTAVVGSIESGEVRAGDRLRVERSGEATTVASVEGVRDADWTPDQPAPVGLLVPDLTPEDVHDGDYLVSA